MVIRWVVFESVDVIEELDDDVQNHRKSHEEILLLIGIQQGQFVEQWALMDEFHRRNWRI